MEVRPALHVAFPFQATGTSILHISSRFRSRLHDADIRYFMLQPSYLQLRHHSFICDRISLLSCVSYLALTCFVYHTDLIFCSLHTANATSSTVAFGHLGLRWGLISKWIGHPFSTLSGAARISLFVFAYLPDCCWLQLDFSCGFDPTDTLTYIGLLLFILDGPGSLPSSLFAYHHVATSQNPFFDSDSSRALLSFEF